VPFRIVWPALLFSVYPDTTLFPELVLAGSVCCNLRLSTVDDIMTQGTHLPRTIIARAQIFNGQDQPDIPPVNQFLDKSSRKADSALSQRLDSHLTPSSTASRFDFYQLHSAFVYFSVSPSAKPYRPGVVVSSLSFGS
jgi:hypothetical protein